MTARERDEKITVLTAEEAAFVRQALVAVSGVFAQAEAIGGPGYRALQEAALQVPGNGHPLARVHYDVCLAVDYIDFPMPVRSAQ